jgi:hypothetical protein
MEAAAQAEVDLAAGQVVALIERHLPEYLLSFNLVGSSVDGDFRAGRSDLDFVAVMRRTPTEDEIEGISIVHRLYASDPTLAALDGIWIVPGDLAAGPDGAVRGPATRDGTFIAEAPGNRNPVTWFMLRDRSRTILGELDRAGIWRDENRLRSWTRENVETYWTRWLADAAKLTTASGLTLVGPRAVMWGVLGISRLHATRATGLILSKSAAGEHAKSVFDPRWQTIIDEALRIRRGGAEAAYGNPFARRREALAYVTMAIEAIRSLP